MANHFRSVFLSTRRRARRLMDLSREPESVSSLERRRRAEHREHNRMLEELAVLDVGRHTYGTPEILTFSTPVEAAERGERVTIGAFCSIGGDVRIYLGGNHRTDWITTFPLRVKLGLPLAGVDGATRSAGAVSIGHDVWIGNNATVLSGVTIGSGAVVGACAVVSSDVPPYAVVVGNPARVVRFRFDEATRERLLQVAWWHWSDEKIIANVAQLSSDAVGGLPNGSPARSVGPDPIG